MSKYRIKLTKEEVVSLQKIVNKGSHSTQTYRAAFILLNVDEGEFSLGKHTNEHICEVLKISMRTIDRVKKKLVEGGGLMPHWNAIRAVVFTRKRLTAK
jgi:hypothetical protein